MKLYRLRNLKTGKELKQPVDEAGLEAIKKAGWMSRYEIIEARTLSTAPRATFIPQEIAARVKEVVGGGETKAAEKPVAHDEARDQVKPTVAEPTDQ